MNYAYWLSNIPGIGNVTIQKLLLQAGCAKELYFMTEKQLHSLAWIGEKEIESLIESRKLDSAKEYDKLEQKGMRFVSMEDEDYPKRLRNIANPPYSIYVKGKLPPEEKKTIAIVGARMCSTYGYSVAKELGKQLAGKGACVISGMARGIDAAGHRGALECAETADEMKDAETKKSCPTVAVLGCGADVCYPKTNRELYGELTEKGGIISEYPPGVQPLAGFFPARNRIIAGLCDVLVVVEAKSRSGSLITADFALEQGKDIYAVPGRMYDTLSMGCNTLLRQGAGIISGIGDFLKELELDSPLEAEQMNFKNLLLEKEERMVYACVDLRPRGIEEILHKTGLTMPELSGILAGLVQKEFITETFKNCYIRRI